MVTLSEMEEWIAALKKAESAALEIGAATLAGDLSEVIDSMEYATDDLRGAEWDRQQLRQMEGPTAREHCPPTERGRNRLMKVEINIPEGWERDTSEFPEHYWPPEDMLKVYVPFRRKDTREDWQKEIDSFIANGTDLPMWIMKGGGGSAIPPTWTAKEYRGWKFYQAPQTGETK